MKFFLNEDRTRFINSIIYKYASVNEHLYSVLTNNEMWFSDPYNFNDPYDCNLNYDWSDISYDVIHSYLIKENAKLGNNKFSDNVIYNKAKFIFEDSNEREQLGKTIITNLVDKQGISCFSESDKILLMWSHYSDKHKGVCLTFDIEKDVSFFRNPYKVDYPETYPKFNPFENSKYEVQIILATKSVEWSYEKEIRIIKDIGSINPNRGAIKFNIAALTEIKFGYKSSLEDIKTISEIVHKFGLNIKLYKASLKKGDFVIEFEQIN